MRNLQHKYLKIFTCKVLFAFTSLIHTIAYLRETIFFYPSAESSSLLNSHKMCYSIENCPLIREHYLVYELDSHRRHTNLRQPPDYLVVDGWYFKCNWNVSELKQVARPLLEKTFCRKIQSRKIFAHRENFETMLNKTETLLSNVSNGFHPFHNNFFSSSLYIWLATVAILPREFWRPRLWHVVEYMVIFKVWYHCALENTILSSCTYPKSIDQVDLPCECSSEFDLSALFSFQYGPTQL